MRDQTIFFFAKHARTQKEKIRKQTGEKAHSQIIQHQHAVSVVIILLSKLCIFCSICCFLQQKTIRMHIEHTIMYSNNFFYTYNDFIYKNDVKQAETNQLQKQLQIGIRILQATTKRRHNIPTNNKFAAKVYNQRSESVRIRFRHWFQLPFLLLLKHRTTIEHEQACKKEKHSMKKTNDRRDVISMRRLLNLVLHRKKLKN